MKWALPVPLHLDPNDHSPDADDLRFHLYQQFFQRRHGYGFRMLPGTSPKRRRPRHGRVYGFNRMVAIRINGKYGDRSEQQTP